jgi:hypothetical protein
MPSLFNDELIVTMKSVHNARIVQPVQIGQTERKNELVFFIKPELLCVEDNAKILNSLKLIEDQFAAHKVDVHGIVILPGNVLADYEIMNRHYGFINQLSRMASEIITAETRAEMFAFLGIEDQGEHKILGGHEFLQTFHTSIETLNDVWFGQGAKKLRSGFYCVADIFNGVPIVLVNGFHPSQLMHFTREDHRILLMLIHTDLDWYDLKFDLIGDTFPERAKPDSIRGQLFVQPDLYGQDSVGINSNGVHLSAGPFEAAFEIVNFFGDILSLDPETTPPLAIRQAMQAGIEPQLAFSLLENPAINESDLFSETENLNTDEAVQFVKETMLTQS